VVFFGTDFTDYAVGLGLLFGTDFTVQEKLSSFMSNTLASFSLVALR
jgi:hypothetical protein